jgi:hypothetical protein
MMGQQPRTESLFYYFRLEDQIPENHLLRLIDRHVDLSFVRERVKSLYSSTGRPSVDPEVLLRLLLVGYLYGITSERRLLEEVRMHLAYRWFTRLDLDREVPNHSYPSEQAHSFAELASVLNSGHDGHERKVGKQAPEPRRDGAAGAGVQRERDEPEGVLRRVRDFRAHAGLLPAPAWRDKAAWCAGRPCAGGQGVGFTAGVCTSGAD